MKEVAVFVETDTRKDKTGFYTDDYINIDIHKKTNTEEGKAIITESEKRVKIMITPKEVIFSPCGVEPIKIPLEE